MKDTNCLDWDAVIEDEGSHTEWLDEEGKFAFTVKALDKGMFKGSAKIPECNKAILTLEVETPNGIKLCKTDLILYKTLEWKLSSFFKSIGQKQSGEKLQMNWGKVVGSRGFAEFRFQNGSDRFFDVNYKDAPKTQQTIPGVEAQGVENPFEIENQELPF